MSKIDLFFLDNSNNTKKEVNIIKPKTYQQLLKQIRQVFKNISQYYEIFIIDKNNNEIKIDNEEKYKIIEDILFIREVDKYLYEKSLFEINYNKLSETKQEILDEKYCCILCSVIIKNEKPYLCYKCQKIFHIKCLKDWDKKCKSQNKKLRCPNCRNELPIEKWNKKLDYEENRKDNAILMERINEYKLSNNMNININLIKDKKFNELKDNEIKQSELIKKYENYINQTIELFKIILNKINNLHNLLKLENNNILNDLINKYPLNIENLNIKDISNVINKELDNFIKNINKAKYKDLNINVYKNKISLIYFVDNLNIHKQYNIFGETFVNNNKDNIDLLINGIPNELVAHSELKEGKNVITLLLKKNKLKNLSCMFYDCNNLKDINDMRYLNVKEVKDFSHMFNWCSSLSDMKPLQNWNVSNCNNLECMFLGCSSLSDIKPLENWNISNCPNFSYMFRGCSSLICIKPLQNWNVFNGNNFSGIFQDCSSLSDIRPLENWNLKNCHDFSYMFRGCSS